jgi:hypothetical protein
LQVITGFDWDPATEPRPSALKTAMLHELGGLQQYGVQRLVLPDVQSRVVRLFPPLTYRNMDGATAQGVLTGKTMC